MIYLNKIVEKLTINKVIIKGVDQDKISTLEQSLNKKLPLCYREFLEKFGNITDAVNVKEGYYDYTGFEGESIFYDDVYGNHTNKDGLLEQLQEDGKTSLISQINDNVFVFFSSQGCIYAFFKLDEGNNPPVYGYQENQKKNNFPKLTNSLLEFFELYLEDGKSPFNNLK